jgi:chemotaxis protein MotA
LEKSSYIGLFLGFIAVGLGMMLKHAPLVSLLNPAAIMIIIVGTVAAVMLAFPMEDLKKVPKLFKLIFTQQKLIPKKQLIQMFIEWVTITRREGLLALESKVDEIEDMFLRNGMRMIIDGNDQEFIHDVLMEEIHAMEERHRSGALIFTQAGTYAPTLGVLGAVVGLIAALSNLSQVDALGSLIAAAFVATLLGIFTGYVLWHPMANKLKQQSKKEVELKLMMVEGLLSIQSGISAIAIEQKLSVFLPPSERYAADEEEEAVDGQKAQQAAS